MAQARSISALSIVPVLLVLGLTVGCVRARDFRAPTERLTDNNAHVLPPGKVRLHAGLLGGGTENLGAALGVAVGIPGRLQLSLNAAHAGMGMLNLYAKWNLLDHARIAIALDVGVLWINPSVTWMLDVIQPGLTDELGDVDIIAVPFGLDITLPFRDVFDLNLTVGYQHGSVFGTVDQEGTILEGAIGGRQVFIEPSMRFYIGRVVAIEVGVHVPVWAVTFESYVTESLLSEGMIVGYETLQWRDRRREDLIGWYTSVEVKLGATHLRLGVRGGPMSRLVGWPLLPSLRAYWRF